MSKNAKNIFLGFSIGFLSVGVLAGVGSFINDGNDWYDNLKSSEKELSSNVASDSLSEEKSLSVEDITTYYLVGSFNGVDNWMFREYPLEVVSCDDSSVKTQYYLEKEFTADDEIKFTDGNDIWVGYESVENPSSSPITDSNGNIAITASGTFSLYLKVYNDGHHSIWMSNFVVSETV